MRNSAWPAILLAAVAGFADALGYLALAHIFTAHMSGNAAAVGAYAGQIHWHDVLDRGLPIPAFLAGALIGATIGTLATRARTRVHLAPAFLVEIALLFAFALLCPGGLPAVTPGSRRFFLLLTLLSAAMGIQATTLRRVGGERISTTFVSGMLVDTVEELIAWAFARHDASDANAIRHHATHASLLAGIFAAFMIGAVAGSVCEVHWGPMTLFLPIAALLIVVLEEVWRRPRQI